MLKCNLSIYQFLDKSFLCHLTSFKTKWERIESRLEQDVRGTSSLTSKEKICHQVIGEHASQMNFSFRGNIKFDCCSPDLSTIWSYSKPNFRAVLKQVHYSLQVHTEQDWRVSRMLESQAPKKSLWDLLICSLVSKARIMHLVAGGKWQWMIWPQTAIY